MKVPFCDLRRLNLGYADAILDATDRVLERGHLILGPEVERFESEWAAYCGMQHAVGVGNGLDAMRLMLLAYGIGPGDDVIVPTNTHIATWLAVTAVGAWPLPVEPDEATHNLDPQRTADAVTPRTKAILAVHLYGRSADMAGLSVVAARHGIPLLVDAAQGHGLKALGDAAAFSFYPTKNLGALGDGGAVLTDDPDVAERVRLLRNYGSAVKNEHATVGMNSRLDELQAAFLLAKLPHLDRANAMRAANAAIYGQKAADHVWHLCVVREPDRQNFREHLAFNGIETAVHYPIPPHLQPAYSKLGYKKGDFPIAEKLAHEVVSLPLEVTPEQARYVAGLL